MAEQSGKTTTSSGKSAAKPRVTTTSPAPTGVRDAPPLPKAEPEKIELKAQPKPKLEVEKVQQPPKMALPSPRANVLVNVTAVETAFRTGGKSRAVRHIQHALTERGFKPGNLDGLVDYDTRAAYSRFQRSIDERPTGIPSDFSLDILGLDVT